MKNIKLNIEPFANTDTVKITNWSAVSGKSPKATVDKVAVATVDGPDAKETMTLTAVGEGTAVLTITATDCTPAKVNITVTKETAIAVDKADVNMTVPAGE